MTETLAIVNKYVLDKAIKLEKVYVRSVILGKTIEPASVGHSIE